MENLHKVWEVKALVRQPAAEEAQKMLEKIAKQVQPIMRKRCWRVKLLSEFCPNNPALLGLNVGGGIHIKLRLRRVNRDLDFIPYDQVLDTMLHELCHNVHGPHNASFYSLWDELRKECEALMSKGISGTGEGFDRPGRRLGGLYYQLFQPSSPALRQAAVAAAKNRTKLKELMPSGPNRVGGDSGMMAALSPVQAAAMAAERRLNDEIWCASQAAETVDRGNSEDFLGDGHDVLSDTKKRKWNERALSDSSGDNQTPKLVVEQPSTSNSDESTQWECKQCTLLNPPHAPLCAVCCSKKPLDNKTKHMTWSCNFCTLENNTKVDKCFACGRWRYSHGPPVSTRGPNVGT